MLINIPRDWRSPETDKASDPSYLNEYKSRWRRLIGPLKNLRFSIVTGLVATLVAVVSTSGLMQAAVVALPDPRSLPAGVSGARRRSSNSSLGCIK